MENRNLLALFDPIYVDTLVQHAQAQGATQNDASAQPQSVEVPSRVLPLKSSRQIPENTLHNISNQHASQNASILRIKSKPFISQHPRTVDMYLPQTPMYPSSKSTAFYDLPFQGPQQVIPASRSVSLPTNIREFHPGQAIMRGRGALSAALHSNRVVSHPESVSSPNRHFVNLPSVSTLATVDETRPLIDLTSPQLQARAHLSDYQSGPAGFIPIHSSFSASFSPPSSPELSDSESIIVSSPTMGRSHDFLRRRAPSSLSDPQSTQLSPSNARFFKTTSAHPAYGNTNDQNTMSVPQPIPALHGPPSLPYARCPSGAEGIMISEQSSLPRMIWGLNDRPTTANTTSKTPMLPQSTFMAPLSQNEIIPRSNTMDTPASTLIGTPLTRNSTPSHAQGAEDAYMKNRQSHLSNGRLPMAFMDRYMQYSKHQGFASNADVTSALGSPVRIRSEAQFKPTPGGYTEYHHVDEPQWQEFIPSDYHTSKRDPECDSHHSESRKVRPYAQAMSPAHNSPSHQAVLQPQAPTAIAERSNTTSAAAPMYAIRKSAPPPPRPKLRDLPAVADLMDTQNVPLRPDPDEFMTNVLPGIWSVPLQQFWIQKFAELGMANSMDAAAFFSSSMNNVIPLSMLSNTPCGPTTQPHTALLPSESNIPNSPLTQGAGTSPQPLASSKSEIYTGALNNPRSIPIARLHRKLTTVTEEGNLPGVNPQPISQEAELEEGELSEAPSGDKASYPMRSISDSTDKQPPSFATRAGGGSYRSKKRNSASAPGSSAPNTTAASKADSRQGLDVAAGSSKPPSSNRSRRGKPRNTAKTSQTPPVASLAVT